MSRVSRYRVGIEAVEEGMTAVWVDLTSDEAAVLGRVAEQLAEASDYQRRLTLEEAE